jgi:tetratricopeptide (TPR) repeat protein
MNRLLSLFLLAPFAVSAQYESLVMQGVHAQLMLSSYYRNPSGHRHYVAQLDSSIQAGHEVANHTYSKALYYMYQRQWDKAMPLFEEACRLDPENHGYTGWVYLSLLRDYPRALAHYDAYDALTPNLDDREGDHAVSYLRSEIFRFMGRHAEALPGYDKAIALVEDKHGPTWVNPRYYVARGQSRLALGRAAEALADFDKAIPNNPSSALSSYWKGRALQALNRPAEARIAYNDALLWLANSTVEQDEYYEVVDSVYAPQIEGAIASLPR